MSFRVLRPLFHALEVCLGEKRQDVSVLFEAGLVGLKLSAVETDLVTLIRATLTRQGRPPPGLAWSDRGPRSLALTQETGNQEERDLVPWSLSMFLSKYYHDPIFETMLTEYISSRSFSYYRTVTLGGHRFFAFGVFQGVPPSEDPYFHSLFVTHHGIILPDVVLTKPGPYTIAIGRDVVEWVHSDKTERGSYRQKIMICHHVPGLQLRFFSKYNAREVAANYFELDNTEQGYREIGLEEIKTTAPPGLPWG